MQRFDRMENKSNTFKHMTTVVNGDYGNVWNWADNTMQKNLELVGDYTKSLGLHNLGLMIGYSYKMMMLKYISMGKRFSNRYVWTLEYWFYE